MKQKAPHVYIAGQRMEDFAASNHPVLAGLTLNFGTDSDLDFPDGDTCTFSLLVKDSEFLDFLQLGEEVAVYHDPPAGADINDKAFTYFTGRIQRLSGDPHPTIKGALLLDVECSDLTADLAALEVFNVNSAAATGQTRLGNLNFWLPDPWTLRGWVRWPDLMHAPMVFDRVHALDLIDAYARAQILRRRNSSTFTPAGGIKREIHLMEDSTKDTRADQLTLFSDGKRWSVVPGRPYGPDVGLVTSLEGGHFHRAAGWVKEPEDVITEVVLGFLEDLEWNADAGRYEESATFDRSSADFPTVGAAPMKARFGHRQASFTTDLGRSVTTTHFGQIMKHWLSTESEWRPSELAMQTTKHLTPHELRLLLSVQYRYSIFLTIRSVMDHRPDAGNQWIRGFMIGGSAVWNGTEWDLTIKLGRNPQPTPGLGDYWTFSGLAADATWNTGTAASIGKSLSFRDFERIGPN